MYKQTEALFRITYESAFGVHKALTIFGCGRSGAFHFKLRGTSKDVTIVNQPLAKGKWRTLMNHMRQARLAELPCEPLESDGMWLDGEVWIVEIKDGDCIIRLRRENEIELRLQRFIDAIVAACSELKRKEVVSKLI